MIDIIETIYRKLYECKSKLLNWDSGTEFVLLLGTESKELLYKQIYNSLTPMTCTGVSDQPDMFMGMKIRTVSQKNYVEVVCGNR